MPDHTGGPDEIAAPSGPDRILLLVADDANRDLLASFLDDSEYDVTVATDPTSLSGPFDLCLVDVEGFRQGRSAVARLRASECPRHLPCLLIAPETRDDRGGSRPTGTRILSGIDGGTELVDDVLLTPIRKAELRCRVRALLRTRRLSLALGNREQQYRRLIELTPEAIFVLDDEEIVYANEAGEELLSRVGRNGDDDPRRLLSFVVPEDRDRVEEFLTDLANDDPPGSAVPATLSRNGAGEGVSVELFGTQVAYGDGTATQLVARDVTERDRREQQLHLYRRAMDEAAVGLTIADAGREDEPLVYANRAFERITGYAPEEILGRNCRFLQGEDTDPRAVEQMREAIAAERPVRVTVRNYRKDGTPFWNEVEITPVRDASGEVTHFLGFQRDVTERVDREHELQALHRATRRLLSARTVEEISEVVVETAEEALDLPAVAVFLADGDRLVPTAASEDTRSLFGTLPTFRPGNFIAWDVFESGRAEIVDDVREDDRTHNPETPVRSELIVPIDDHGVFVSGSLSPSAFTEADRQFVRTLAMNAEAALDRTDREMELRRRERELQRYETIVRATGEPIYTLDAEGNFVDVNEALVEMTGYDRERLIGSHVSLVMTDEDIQRCEAVIADLLSEGDTDASVEIGIETTEGEVRRSLVNIALLPMDDGFRGTVGVVRDITDRHRRAQRLEVMDRVLRHNLRNEMNVVRGRVQAIRELIPEEGLEHVEEIVRSTEALLSLSEGARRFHEAFHADADDAVGTLDLAGEVDSAATALRDRFPDATVAVSAPESAPARAHDATRIAIEELIENAVTHAENPAPRVAVTVTVEDDWVVVAVADEGPGLPPAERKTIEGELESALDHSSGLGLWLVSWIVDSSGGEIDCETSGEGTTFRLRFRRP